LRRQSEYSIVLELEGGGRRCRVIWRKEKLIGVRFTDRVL
jgi:hypothetical protein